MIIKDIWRKINPVVNFGIALRAGRNFLCNAKIYYGVKSWAGGARVYEGEIWVIAIVLLGSSLVLGAGRFLWLEQHREPVKIYRSPENGTEKSQNTKVYASSKGTKYYLPWCKSSIKLANKIEFMTEAMAIAAGYQKAKNCK